MFMDNNIKLLIIGVGSLLILFVLIIGAIAILGSSFGGTIAVIPIQGEIGYGSSDLLGGSVANPEIIKNQINEADNDGSVSAILLDINSPGGTPVASEEIMDEIKDCKKPVVAWISDTGASGAYLAATGADKIVASPSSMVGSIGVILDLTNISELYKKIGVTKTVIKGGKYKDIGADYRNMTPEEKTMLQNMVNEHYDHFISIVAENRNLNKSYVSSIAEGQIYTGSQAKTLKLIDEIGSKEEALDMAAKMGGIDGSYEIVTMTTPQSFEDILSSISSKLGYSIGKGIGSLMEEDSIQNVFY
jgi:protease IV